jgi:hypothetical protein
MNSWLNECYLCELHRARSASAATHRYLYSAATHRYLYSAATHRYPYSAATHRYLYSAATHRYLYSAATHRYLYSAATHRYLYSAATHRYLCIDSEIIDVSAFSTTFLHDIHRPFLFFPSFACPTHILSRAINFLVFSVFSLSLSVLSLSVPSIRHAVTLSPLPHIYIYPLTSLQLNFSILQDNTTVTTSIGDNKE